MEKALLIRGKIDHWENAAKSLPDQGSGGGTDDSLMENSDEQGVEDNICDSGACDDRKA